MQLIASPEQVLANVFGYNSFRNNQEAIINQVLEGGDAMVLMPTGGGKSLCYQVPALCLPGLTVVVSPLIALMKDQVDALVVSGVKAAFLNSTLSAGEQAAISQQVWNNELKLLYVAPERLVGADKQFLKFLQGVEVSLFAIDEAHCISQWGHDFRPEYRILSDLKKYFPETPLIALTATADALTRDDIIAQLHLEDCPVFENSFNRPNIRYTVKPKQGYYGALVNYLQEHQDDAGIIYCLSRAATEKLAEDLTDDGFQAVAYHAGLDRQTRETRQEQFLRDEVRIIVATIAFGMGINKSNVRFVVHADLPKNLEGYYQETGRAGRDGLDSEAILFYGQGDVMKLRSFAQVEGNEEQTAILMQKLALMVQFCETRRCRRKYLLNYFGEKTVEHCNNCDTCLNKAELVDATVPAQKILSAVVRLNERFGGNYVIDVLRGSMAEKIRPEHKGLSVFGKGKDLSKEIWQHYLRELVQDGYLQQSSGEYPILQLTHKSRAVLYNGEQVMLPAPNQPVLVKEPAKVYEKASHEKSLFEDLKKLRTRFAQEENVPPYIILSDSTLMELSTYLPLKHSDLQHISGLGAFKIEKYGNAFLETVQDYCIAAQMPTRMHLKGPLKEKKIKPVKKKETDTKKLSYEYYQKGLSMEEIAEARNLSTNTIADHLSFYINRGSLKLDAFVTGQHQSLIKAAIDTYGRNSLKQLKDNLPDRISYASIRMVLATLPL
jgi:ATP-dependent DNA helicase RecQ